MDSPKRTATASMPEDPPLDERAVNQVVKDNKLKIVVDLYFWVSGHFIALYVSFAESLGFRETPLESNKKRVRWTCVSLSDNFTFSFGKWLIGLCRFAVAVCTMTFSSSCLTLSKVYNSIWTTQAQNFPSTTTLGSMLFDGGRKNPSITSFELVTLINWWKIVPKQTPSGFYHFYVKLNINGYRSHHQHSIYMTARIHQTQNSSYI